MYVQFTSCVYWGLSVNPLLYVGIPILCWNCIESVDWKCIWSIQNKVENFNEIYWSQTWCNSFNYLLHMFCTSQLLSNRIFVCIWWRWGKSSHGTAQSRRGKHSQTQYILQVHVNGNIEGAHCPLTYSPVYRHTWVVTSWINSG